MIVEEKGMTLKTFGVELFSAITLQLSHPLDGFFIC